MIKRKRKFGKMWLRRRKLPLLISTTLFISIFCFLFIDIQQSHITPSILKKRNIQVRSLTNSVDFSFSFHEIDSLASQSYFDTSGKYNIIPFVHVAENWTNLSKEIPVCAALMATLDRSDQLIEFISSWSGPISLAIFAPGPESFLTLQFIKFVIQCYPNIRNQVSFHIVYPISRPPQNYEEKEWSILENCKMSASKVLKYLLDLRSIETVTWREKIKMPQNLLRNIAKDHCQTPYITVIDIDMIFPKPSLTIKPSIMQLLTYFLNSSEAENCDKCAFVIPIFELDDKEVFTIPKNKKELKYLIKNRKARQYHIKDFNQNQRVSHLNSKWLKLIDSNVIQIVYTVDDFEFLYEPIYISKIGIPKYEERYVGFGMVRNTQIYEMYLQNYTFHILDNIFLSHWGYKLASSVSEFRKSQASTNYKTFVNSHLRELVVKYDKDPLGLQTSFPPIYKNFSVSLLMQEVKKT